MTDYDSIGVRCVMLRGGTSLTSKAAVVSRSGQNCGNILTGVVRTACKLFDGIAFPRG